VTTQSRGIRRGIGRRGIAALAALFAGFLLVPSAAGAAPRTDTAQVVRTLSGSASIPGTAWLVDAASHRVRVIADSTVTGANLQRLKTATRPYGDAVLLERVTGRLGVRLSGGDPITGGSFRCTAGANVRSGSTYYFVTAGHCGSVEPSWYTSTGDYIGPTVGSTFPGHDYSLVRYDGSVSHEGTVGDQDITAVGNAYVGEHVCMRGGTSGIHCGTVLGLNATVNYAEGTVNGLIETNICAGPGDSGAPLYDGSTLLGILSGGSGDCTSGGISFFQPITQILSAYGVTIY
jgi:streptogrisin B